MQNERSIHRTNGEASFGELIRELGGALSGLVRSELQLVKAEAKETGSRLAGHALKAAVFGAILALSILPFMAFLVIGLGDLLNGRYWLSSLIVAVLFAGIGGIFAKRAFQEIKDHDLELPHTLHSLEREKEAILRKINEMKHATERNATNDRRAV